MASYIGTHALFIALQRIFQVDSNADLATLILIPTSTISVWICRNILPAELMIQLKVVLDVDSGALCYRELAKIPHDWILKPNTKLNKQIKARSGQRLLNALLNEFQCDSYKQLSITMGVDRHAINVWLERDIVPHHILFNLYALRGMDLRSVYRVKSDVEPSCSTYALTR